MDKARNPKHACLHRPPFILQWRSGDKPLPLRVVRCPKPKLRLPFWQAPPPWIATGSSNEPFDFSAAIRLLSEDIVARCDAFAHIDCDRLLFTVTQARNGFAHGLQARVTPMRFSGGKLRMRRRGGEWCVQRFFADTVEFLYVVSFCLPRYLNQDFDGKLVTLFHELYHIGTDFDGDLRRHNGRYCLHSHSQRSYDEKMAKLARAYLGKRPDRDRLAFLRLSFAQLQKRHGSVVGVMVPRPKILPVV